MEDQNKLGPIGKLIESAKSFIIILPPEPSQDQICAGLSLHLALTESGKQSQIGCGSEVEVEQRAFGTTKIADTIGSKNLVISFEYAESDLDKVDYDTREDGRFYLLVKPKSGSPVPDASNVKFSYSGAEADLVIVLGINSLEELGKIYAEEKNFLDSTTILSLSDNAQSVTFTNNILQRQNCSFSEMVVHLLETTSLKTTAHSATNLLNSIYQETDSLTSSKISADTFSSLAFLMRSGARIPNQQIFVPKFAQPPFFEVPHAPESPADLQSEEDPRQVPMDWKQPKVFRANNS
jgi:hypothetical protein